MSAARENVVLLVGGVGGAKLAVGLAEILPPQALTIIVNTGDDFRHLGLHVSPDLDTVMYTLAGLANPKTGWGVCDDTFRAMDMLQVYRGPDWFRLGDRDLGTNLMRTLMLAQGYTLTETTAYMCRSLGIQHKLSPMSDDPVRTMLDTDIGMLAFQEYFVREQWQPVVSQIRFEGVIDACPSNGTLEAIRQASAIIIGPSNPFLSIDPILAVPGIRASIITSRAPKVAVSPVVGGKAIKGPTVKLMRELGLDATVTGVVEHYQKLVDGIILDSTDQELLKLVTNQGIKASAQQTIMHTLEDKVALAESLLGWIEDNYL